MASIPYKIAIDNKAEWMFPAQASMTENGVVVYGQYTNINGSPGLGDIGKGRHYTSADSQDPIYISLLDQRPYTSYAVLGEFDMFKGKAGQTYAHFNEGKLKAVFTLVSPGLTPLGRAQTLVHEIIHTYLCYKKYILKENVNPFHVNNAGPYTASNPQTEGNTLLNNKIESHMHRTFTLNTW
jgi:hypothetical protein